MLGIICLLFCAPKLIYMFWMVNQSDICDYYCYNNCHGVANCNVYGFASLWYSIIMDLCLIICAFSLQAITEIASICCDVGVFKPNIIIYLIESITLLLLSTPPFGLSLHDLLYHVNVMPSNVLNAYIFQFTAITLYFVSFCIILLIFIIKKCC